MIWKYEGSKVVGLFHVSVNGGVTSFSSLTPIITLDLPSSKASTACTPSRLAKIRSKAVGEPPRWTWPRTVTRIPLRSEFSLTYLEMS